jgi:hypothetical protein
MSVNGQERTSTGKGNPGVGPGFLIVIRPPGSYFQSIARGSRAPSSSGALI